MINLTQLATALIFAFAVVCLGIVVMDSITQPVKNIPAINDCEVCHTNLNITENKTSCTICAKTWSSAY